MLQSRGESSRLVAAGGWLQLCPGQQQAALHWAGHWWLVAMVTVRSTHSAHYSAHTANMETVRSDISTLYSIILAVSVLVFKLIISEILCLSVPLFVFFYSNAHVVQFSNFNLE